MAKYRRFLFCFTLAMTCRAVLAERHEQPLLVKPGERAVVGTTFDRILALGDETDRIVEFVGGSAGLKFPSLGKAPEVDLVRIRLLRMQALLWQKQGMRGDLAPPVPPRNARGAGDDERPERPGEDADFFDDWAFGGKEGRHKFRLQLDRLLDRKLAEVKQFFDLTAAQERKLRLAGKGDLQRLLDLVDQSHREFDRSRTDPARLGELRKDLRLVELRVSEGPFEMGSLFTKTLRKLYDDGQLTRKRPPPAH